VAHKDRQIEQFLRFVNSTNGFHKLLCGHTLHINIQEQHFEQLGSRFRLLELLYRLVNFL
jgi:hypothetical protein